MYHVVCMSQVCYRADALTWILRSSLMQSMLICYAESCWLLRDYIDVVSVVALLIVRLLYVFVCMSVIVVRLCAPNLLMCMSFGWCHASVLF